MHAELSILLATAAGLGLVHTLFGPDHYLPFIVMARSGRWSLAKTAWVTAACGLGHVLSSVLLGAVGVALGIAVNRLEAIEAYRGGLEAWALIAFGLAYGMWGLRRAVRSRPHAHPHTHEDGGHEHEHQHRTGHSHVHADASKRSMTPWVLFIVFVLGPCEPLIPILMYPAARGSTAGLVLVTAVFGAVTIATMLGVVLAASLGVRILPVGRLERYSHALAGAAILLCGVAIRFLGL